MHDAGFVARSSLSCMCAPCVRQPLSRPLICRRAAIARAAVAKVTRVSRIQSSMQPLWVDTDAGVDDAQALVICLGSGMDVVGMSTVHGNTSISNVNKNVLRVLTACSKDHVPVYEGAAEPLVCELYVPGAPYHGNDGLGDCPEVWPTAEDVKAKLSPGNAAIKLIECATKCEGQLTILALGPLTNIAMAVKLDPGLPGRVKKLVIMGGAKGPGNMSPHAEYNFFCDPEAAKVVLNKWFTGVTIVPRDLGLNHLLPMDEFKKMLTKPTRIAKFLAGISEQSITRAEGEGECSGYLTHDPGAAAVAVAPELIGASDRVYCDIELQGLHTRGMSVFDWEGHLKKAPNAEVITSLNMQAFMQLFDKTTQ